jgi:hypothetical protein
MHPSLVGFLFGGNTTSTLTTSALHEGPDTQVLLQSLITLLAEMGVEDVSACAFKGADIVVDLSVFSVVLFVMAAFA